MQLQPSHVPTAIGNFSVTLAYIANPGPEEQQKQVLYDIQVLDENGHAEWLQQGDLVPYLDDSSNYLTTVDRAALLDFMTRVYQEAVARILGA